MEQKILEKLESMDKKFTAQFSEVDKKFSNLSREVKNINKKLNEHTEQIDLIAGKVAEHDTDIKEIKTYLKEEVATKKDLERIYTSLDEILGHVKKNDQEITFMGQRVTRLEKQVFRK